MAISLGLTLFVVACSTAPRPSIAPPSAATGQGNRYRLVIPRGTQLLLPTQARASELQAIAYNEIDPVASSARTLVLAADLQLVSPAYIAERNGYELQLVKIIEDQKSEIAHLRAK